MAKILSKEHVLEYSKEFKYKVVQLSEVGGIKTTQIAEGLGLHPVMIYRWRQEYREGKLVTDPDIRRVSMTMSQRPPPKPSKKHLSENEHLRKENALLKRENDLLKKWQRYLAEVRQNDSDTLSDTDRS